MSHHIVSFLWVLEMSFKYSQDKFRFCLLTLTQSEHSAGNEAVPNFRDCVHFGLCAHDVSLDIF
jgi:hypothetical protein